MSEEQLQNAIIDLALTLGWKVSWAPDWMKRLAITSMKRARRGDRRWPPAGTPDLICARGGRLLIAELKSHAGSLKPEQQDWLAELMLVPSVEVHLWRPEHWISGEIEAVLA